MHVSSSVIIPCEAESINQQMLNRSVSVMASVHKTGPKRPRVIRGFFILDPEAWTKPRTLASPGLLIQPSPRPLPNAEVEILLGISSRDPSEKD